jgi:hypothetical protein
MCLFSVITYKFTDCTYVIDNIRKCIDYQRNILGVESRYTICRFDEIQCVTTNATYISQKHGSYYEYNVVIVTVEGAIIDVTNGWRDALDVCDVFAQMLAEHFNAEFLPGLQEQQVTLLPHSDGSGNTITFEKSGWAMPNPKSLYPVIAWAMIAFAFFIFYIAMS